VSPIHPPFGEIPGGKPLKRLLLIRHGQSEWNRERRWQGHSDVPLSEEGRGQAEALAGRLLGWAIDVLCCSDSRRAAETAEIIGEALKLSPQPDPDWRERDIGDFAGPTDVEAKERYPEVIAAAQATGHFDPPGGEGHDALRARAIRVFTRLLELHPGDVCVAMVSHGGLIRAVLEHALGLPEDGSGSQLGLSANTGLSLLEFDARGISLLKLGDTQHLPDTGMGF
jgi:broad specificity phosphatase PhoE